MVNVWCEEGAAVEEGEMCLDSPADTWWMNKARAETANFPR